VEKLYKLIFSLVLFLILNVGSFAQCVMCSATIEANKSGGGNTGVGINTGVAYLSFFPYLILGFFGFIFYKVYKKDKAQQEQS